ncbi:hypothetical protein F3157_22345 [Virgibacillus dakarensis]|nr:hypothetical protein [Virgibacillus dakarensis]
MLSNLNTLSKRGFIRELAFGNSSTRYDGDVTNHYHIICEGCGKIVDFHYPLLEEIEALVEQMENFEVSYHQLNIYGKCQDCITSKKNGNDEEKIK